MARLKVLEINPYLTSNRGGVERRIFGLSKALAHRGHQVTAVTGPAEGESAASSKDGFAVRRLAPEFFEAGTYDPPFLSAKGFAESVKGLQPDVVDIHYMWTPDYTRSLKKLRPGTPIVYTLHNSFGVGEGVEGRAAYLSDSVLKFFLRNCDAAVCLTDFIRRDLRGRGIPADKLRVVPSGIEPTPDAELAALRAGAPRRKGPYAVFAGRLERTKGLDVLVEAARDVDPALSFVILGKGPDLEGLQAEARDFGVANRFSFEGFVAESRKRELIAQADLFVYPATFEPSGASVLEAMDLGCPVVATSVGGIPEVVGRAAKLVAPGDADALAGALTALVGDAEARRALGAAGRARAAHCGWPKAALAMETAFEAAGARGAA